LYESKFEEYKDSITSKFSTFIDGVLDEEMIIPEHIVEYARKGELYEDLIEEFKTRLRIDEGNFIEDEARELMAEAHDEIVRLSTELDESIDKNFSAEDILREARSEIIKHDLCDGLTFSQKKKVMGLLEGVTGVEDIYSKFEFITESLGILNEEDEDEDGEDEDEDGDKDEKKGDKKKDKEPDEDGDDKETNESRKNKGKGHREVITESKNASPLPWDKLMEQWAGQLKPQD